MAPAASRADRVSPSTILHDQEVDAVLVADVVKRTDAGVGERRDGARLALESLPPLRIRGHLRRQHLQRDRPTQPRIASAIHLTHAAGANQRLDFERAEPHPGCQCRHRCRRRHRLLEMSSREEIAGIFMCGEQ